MKQGRWRRVKAAVVVAAVAPVAAGVVVEGAKAAVVAVEAAAAAIATAGKFRTYSSIRGPSGPREINPLAAWQLHPDHSGRQLDSSQTLN
jgi:hypothetical protein